jgi:hypothetical protein
VAALAEVRAPAILFWEFNHYVVYDGMGRRFGRRGVHINDPGKGRRFVAMEDFDSSFTGVVLVMEPGDDFEKGGRRPGVLGAMPARMRGTSGTLPAAVLASLLLVAVGAAVPALSRTYIDMFLIGGQTSLLGVLFTSMGACVLLTVLLGGHATKLTINAGFEKMIPHGHEYVRNYLESRGSLRGLGNSVRVVVENTDGDIFDPRYLEVLKQVNDEQGHAAGDELLRAVGRALEHGLRTYDVVVRHGGDEFISALPGLRLPDARRRLDQVATLLAAEMPGATISVGAVELQPVKMQSSTERMTFS